MIEKMIRSIEEVFNAKSITTDAMNEAMNDWYNLYYARNVEESEDPCQRIPYAVVNKIEKAMFAEYSAESKNDGVQNLLNEVNKVKGKIVQQMLIGGSDFVKPLTNGTFVVVPRENVVVFGRDEHNNVIDIGTAEMIEDGGNYYTFCERITVKGNKLEIKNVLYKSNTSESIGRPVSLNELPRYEMLLGEDTLPIDHIGMVEFRCPVVNCVDGSDDAVSVYAAAARLIHNINKNEAQLNGEFERGESRLIVSSDYLRNGKLKDNVFTGLDDDPESVGVTIFSPALREQSFLTRKIEYLRNVESVIGLKRGLLSDVETQDKTATEITSSAGDYNLTIIDFQGVFEENLKRLIEISTEILKAYKKANISLTDDSIIVNWGNGVLYDRDKTWGEYMTMVSAGLLKPEIAVGFYFNLPFKTPEDLKKIRESYMPELMSLMEQV